MNRQVINLIPVLAFVILAGLFAFNSNLSIDAVHAESGDAQASLEIDPVIDISAPSTVILNCTPGSTDAASQLCTSNATISVTTNNITGYTLQMNTTSGSSNSLTNSAASPAATIPTLSQAYASANFPVNYWGYTGGTDKSSETGGYNCSTNYCPILAYESTATNYAPNHTIKQTDAPANNSTTTLTFAGRVNTTKPSGTYTTSITFTAVANELPLSPITNGMYMQDIDSDVCLITPFYSESNTVYTVIDSRDNAPYDVAKLEDGNCWMVQNLGLGEYGNPEELTEDTSNVSPEGYILEFDFENNSINKDSYGNYYSYSQATAGSGDDASSQEDAPYDICPAGWRLPSSIGYYDLEGSPTDSEFYLMFNPYIVTTGYWNNNGWYDITPTDLTGDPLMISLPGAMDSAGSLSSQGTTGFWWSATKINSTEGLTATVDNTYGNWATPVYPMFSDISVSVRCLVPGL